MADSNPFITTANPMQQTMIDPEAQALQRQKQIAAALMQQGFQQPQSQMVSGHYVAPSWTQYLANLGNAYIGNKIMTNADKEQLALAEKLRQETAQGLTKYNELRYGSQGTPDVVPEGQTLRDDQGNLTYGAKEGVAPVAANPKAAFDYAMMHKSPLVNQMALEMLKPQKLGAEESIQVYNPAKGVYESQATGQGKFHEPMKVDTGNGTLLIDPKTQKQLGFIPKTPNQAETLSNTGTLRGQFINESAPHVQIANAYQKVISAPTTAAGDMSKIFGYMKILDPSSTVREGEYASAQNATGVPGRILNLYNSVLKGEKLTPAQRAEFDQAAGALVKSQMQQYQGIEQHYTGIAKGANVNPAHIVRNPYAGITIAEAPTAPTQAQLQGTGRGNPFKGNIGIAKPSGLTDAEWNAMSDADKALWRK